MDTRDRSAGMAMGRPDQAVRLARADAARRRRRRNSALLGLALGVLLGLVSAPRSGWIVSEHARRALQPTAATITMSDIRFARDLSKDRDHVAAFIRTAATRPDDASVQTAALTLGLNRSGGAAYSTNVLDAFLPLLEDFPGTPEAHAAALRLTATRLARGETEVPQEMRAWAFDQFLRITGRGEALDPENAFFPTMRAAALYADGRGPAARAALAAAAARTAWRDGIAFEVEGAWKISDAAFGAGNPAARAGLASSIELTTYPLLRQAAEAAERQAAAAERAGHRAEADAIRRDVLAVGRTIRIGSSTLSGSLAGAAIEQAAAGTVRPPRSDGQRETVLRLAAAGSGHLDISGRLRRFGGWFAFGQALLAGALWAAILAFLAGLARRLVRGPRASRWGRAVIGLSDVALPAACLLVLLYGVATLQTLRQAASINRSLTAMVQHEGRFYAALSGLPWPE